jgi:hypothetical protein
MVASNPAGPELMFRLVSIGGRGLGGGLPAASEDRNRRTKYPQQAASAITAIVAGIGMLLRLLTLAGFDVGCTGLPFR